MSVTSFHVHASYGVELTALHISAYICNIAFIKVLLKRGADPFFVFDSSDRPYSDWAYNNELIFAYSQSSVKAHQPTRESESRAIDQESVDQLAPSSRHKNINYHILGDNRMRRQAGSVRTKVNDINKCSTD
jgi:hypothetical protein